MLGKRGLEDRQGLAQFHRPALELAEDAEEVFGGALLRLLAEDLVGQTGDALAESHRGAPGQSQRQRGELHPPRQGPPREVVARMGVSMPVAHVPHAHAGGTFRLPRESENPSPEIPRAGEAANRSDMRPERFAVVRLTTLEFVAS
ncbi:hypothetical protein GCM10029992_25660 [Glycomyces albus]